MVLTFGLKGTILSNKKGKATTVENELLLQALEYARRGFRVFPLYTPVDGGCSCGNGNCNAPGKHPRVKGWKREATTDESTIRNWWSKWPSANVGIATGKESGLVVVDLDGPLGIDNWESLCDQYGFKPDTLIVTTGRGRHLYFSHPGGAQ